MKRIYILTIVLLLLMTPFAQAALVDNGDGTITDTDTGIIWLQDANYAFTSGYDDDGLMTWDEAMTWAKNLDFAGYTDWRLPNAHDQGSSYYVCVGYNCTESEMGHLYYTELGNSPGGPLTNTGPFVNVQAWYYWSETERWALPSQAWDFDLGIGRQYPYDKTYNDNAWAVRTFPVMIAYKPGFYPTNQTAYDTTVEGDIIMSQGIAFYEDLFIDEISNKSVSLAGGYNDDFSSITGKTTIYGDMIVSNGTLIIEFGFLELI